MTKILFREIPDSSVTYPMGSFIHISSINPEIPYDSFTRKLRRRKKVWFRVAGFFSDLDTTESCSHLKTRYFLLYLNLKLETDTFISILPPFN